MIWTKDLYSNNLQLNHLIRHNSIAFKDFKNEFKY